jgi:hypothetical protein
MDKYKFDIVIPVGPNDINIINKQIIYTKKNIIGYNNIYLISFDPSLIIKDCITINENIFPFTINTVINYHGKLSRNGWYLQQLLKLYAGIVIPNILDRYLVIDCDTFFLKPITFIEDGKCLYNYGTEYHKPYFSHMANLDSSLVRIDEKKSGICHHMIFETKYIKEIIYMVEKNHNDKFFNVFLMSVHYATRQSAGASEYEIYFNFMLNKYSNMIKFRKLRWRNIPELITNTEYDYLSVHWHIRKKS